MKAIRLTMGQKFLGIGLLVVGLFGLPLMLHVNGLREGITNSGHEREALVIYKEVFGVLQRVQKHRGLNSAVLTGNATAVPKREAMGKEVEGILTHLDALSASHPAFHLSEPLTKVEEKWRTLLGQRDKLTVPESLANHAAIIKDVMALRTKLLNTSGMLLDPEGGPLYLV